MDRLDKPRRRTPPYTLTEVLDKPFTYEVSPETRCQSTFPDCKDIRCQREMHYGKANGVCFATSRDPYYSVFWEAPGKEETA